MYPTKDMTELSLRTSLSMALEHPVVLNALLSTTSAGLHSHIQGGNPRHNVSAIYFKGEAIRHLNQTLSQCDGKPMGIFLAYAVSLLLGTAVNPPLLGRKSAFFANGISVCKEASLTFSPT